jgi:hypothetical protein
VVAVGLNPIQKCYIVHLRFQSSVLDWTFMNSICSFVAELLTSKFCVVR